MLYHPLPNSHHLIKIAVRSIWKLNFEILMFSSTTSNRRKGSSRKDELCCVWAVLFPTPPLLSKGLITHCRQNNIKILQGDYSAKFETKKNQRPTTGRNSFHHTANNNSQWSINFASRKNMDISSICSYIVTFINLLVGRNGGSKMAKR